MAENFSIQYSQANSGKLQPALPQAEENCFQNFNEYALVNRTIGFHGQEETFGNMQKPFLRVERPMARQAVPQSLK